MSPESRRFAGILLVIMPTVAFGGVSILTLLINDPEYVQNQLRQDLWRAGHAHAGVLLVLSLIALRYVDEANLSDTVKQMVRRAIPASAILIPAAIFLSVLTSVQSSHRRVIDARRRVDQKNSTTVAQPRQICTRSQTER